MRSLVTAERVRALARALGGATTTPTRGSAWASRLAERHNLTLYDAAYAAVAEQSAAVLVTRDHGLSTPGLGIRPSEFRQRIAAA